MAPAWRVAPSILAVAFVLWATLAVWARRHLDTAHDYGTEPDVGAAMKASGVGRKDAGCCPLMCPACACILPQSVE